MVTRSGDCGCQHLLTFVLLGKGDGTFNPAVPYAISGGGIAVTVADFNGDGHPLGSGAFTPATSFATGGQFPKSSQREISIKMADSIWRWFTALVRRSLSSEATAPVASSPYQAMRWVIPPTR